MSTGSTSLDVAVRGPVRPRAAAVEAAGRRRWDVVAAALALLLLGLDLPLAGGATSATAVVLALVPVWLPALHRATGMVALVVLGVAAVPAGLVLAWRSGPVDGRGWDQSVAVATALLLLTAAGGVGLVLWARTVLPLDRVALLVGTGLLLDGLTDLAGSPNPWKYALSFPVTIVVLALLARRRLTAGAGALVVLAVIGVTNESRSYAAFCLLAAALVVWRSRPSGSRSKLGVASVIGAVGFTGYQVGTELLVKGYLGEVLQERSVQQVQNAGSLIAGGRPEWAATRELFLAHPSGFGLGAVPSSEDLRTAKQGLDTVGISGDNGYVTSYMFGGDFKLHAVVADLWASFGVVGIVLAGLLVGLVVHALVAALAAGRPAAVVVFGCLMGLWWLGFGPIYSNLLDVAIILGLAAPLRGARAAG